MVQIATMLVILTPEFNTQGGDLLPLPTATEQISELLTKCVMEGEVSMDLQEEWKNPSLVLLPVVRESTA